MKELFSKVGDQRSLSFKVEQKIEEAIRGKKIKVGEKLPTESEFCELFSVSRTVVREAMKKLSARGLVTIIKGSGVYVSELDAQKALNPLNLFFEMSESEDIVLDTIRTRQIIEPEIASYAAKNRTSAQLSKLEKNLEGIIKCVVTNIKKEMEIDIKFHSLIAEAAGNQVINILLSPIFNLIPKYKKSIFAKSAQINLQGEKNKLIKYHSDIFNAIKDKDSKSAHKAMLDHLKNTERNFIKTIR